MAGRREILHLHFTSRGPNITVRTTTDADAQFTGDAETTEVFSFQTPQPFQNKGPCMIDVQWASLVYTPSTSVELSKFQALHLCCNLPFSGATTDVGYERNTGETPRSLCAFDLSGLDYTSTDDLHLKPLGTGPLRHFCNGAFPPNVEFWLEKAGTGYDDGSYLPGVDYPANGRGYNIGRVDGNFKRTKLNLEQKAAPAEESVSASSYHLPMIDVQLTVSFQL